MPRDTILILRSYQRQREVVDEQSAVLAATIQSLLFVLINLVFPWFFGRWLVRKSPTFGFAAFATFITGILTALCNFVATAFLIGFAAEFGYVVAGQSAPGDAVASAGISGLVFGLSVGAISTLKHRRDMLNVND